MDKVLYDIKDQLYQTAILVVNFFSIPKNIIIFVVVVLILYMLFFRKWESSKVFSFCLTYLLLFVLYVRLDNILGRVLSTDGAYYGISVFHIVSAIIAAVILVYYSMIKS